MIFSKELAAQILAGTKTETRRLVKEGDGTVNLSRRRGRTVVTRPFRPQVGKSYAVQPGRGQAEVFRIICTGRRRELLGLLDHDAAVAEGFPRGRVAFARYWLHLYEPRWPRIEKVFCPTCTLDEDYPADELPPCPQCGGESEVKIRPTPTDAEVMVRFEERWEPRVVWVIEFELDRSERAQLLIQRGGFAGRPDDSDADEANRPEARGYTTSTQLGLLGGHHTVPFTPNDKSGVRALPGAHTYPEPEAVTGADWDKHVRRTAYRDAQQWIELELAQRDADRRLLALERRMTEARRLARQSVDLRGEFRALDRMLAQRAAPEKVERQAKRIEGKVDRQLALKHGSIEEAA